jgi:thiol-disulfide isomerase/thioredoxin
LQKNFLVGILQSFKDVQFQIKFLDQAEKEFSNILFLSFEQTKDKDIAKQLSIDYWTTIVIYKNNKEVYRSIGQTDKAKIYEAIKSL